MDTETTAGGDARFGECYAALHDGVLTLGNRFIERRWQVKNGLLFAVSFLDRETGREWLSAPAAMPAPFPEAVVPEEPRTIAFSTRSGAVTPTEALSLLVELSATGAQQTLTYRFQIFPEARGVLQQLTATQGANGPQMAATSAAPDASPSGVETQPPASDQKQAAPDVLENLRLSPYHLRLTQVRLLDQTDIRNELAFENEWLLHPSDTDLALDGNLFFVEDPLTQSGLVFLKHAPLPHARPVKKSPDLHANGNENEIRFCGNGAGPEGGEGYRFVTLSYHGGAAGRVATLQEYQRQLRVFQPERDGLFLSNTWGDRSRDSRINEPFMRREVEAGARLGVDVVQIDDGWQAGRTSNSAQSGGVWEGFWSANARFWEPHPERFPNGLVPILDAAREQGMQFGLWFAPDSNDDFAHWKQDAERLLTLYRTLGIHYFKIDGVQMRSKQGERNLHRFFARVLEESKGAVVFDLDVTASTRPGYFSLMQTGPIFVENRYTDWRRYFPHQTLRNLWKLAHYLDPVRLRMEFLNNTRNGEKYGEDPLAPSHYRPDYLFATVMFASPLGWFEVSNLPEEYFGEAAPLVQVWKEHRTAIFGGRILPLGEAPDGAAWTGFASVASDGQSGYILLFRELNDQEQWSCPAPLFAAGEFTCQVLGGRGNLTLSGNQVVASIPRAQDFLFARVEKA